MKLLNAKLDVQYAMSVADRQWQFSAAFVDNTGMFSPYDVQVGDIVYTTGMSQVTYEMYLCRYKILSINSINGAEILFTAAWDEPTGDDYAEPMSGYDTVISRALHNGLSAITSTDNGISPTTVEAARNLDLAVANFGGTGATVPGIKVKVEIMDIANRVLPVGQAFVPDTELVTMNGLPLSEGEDCDYTIVDNDIVLTPEVELTVGDIFRIRCKPAA